jgi:hypothetical protein
VQQGRDAPSPTACRRSGAAGRSSPPIATPSAPATPAARSKDFADTRARFATRQGADAGGGFDVALLPIGGYAPRWFMSQQHVDPAEAVQIHLDLGAKRSIGMRWGTFEPTDESLDQPPIALAAARGLAEEAFSDPRHRRDAAAAAARALKGPAAPVAG